jgi:3' terminal RNA ribose 2'-O-methyltransferase Hen1
MAFERLAGEEPEPADEAEESGEKPDKNPNLNARRLGSVVAALKNCGAKSVIDLGCGEGNLLALLVKEKQFTSIAGADVSGAALEHAGEKLRLARAGDSLRERVQLFLASLTYKDARFSGYDAACVVEVIEHLDVSRLAAFERVLFEFARPSYVVLTTPNSEYNINYKDLHKGELRHGDHRFEWTRQEFRDWAAGVAEKFGYSVQFSGIGDIDETHGAPAQMGVFRLCQ